MGDLQLLKNATQRAERKTKAEKYEELLLCLKEFMLQLGICDQQDCKIKDTCTFYRRKPAVRKVEKLYNMLYLMLEKQKEIGIFPRMPSQQWVMANPDNPTLCQWEDDEPIAEPGTKPSIIPKPNTKGYKLKRIKVDIPTKL